jgi:hypothetical protein
MPSLSCWGAALLLLAVKAEAAPCQLTDLQWLSGTWRNTGQTTETEERWTVGPGGRLIGSSWLLHTDGPGGVIEALSIQDEGSVVSMHLRHFSSTLDQAREEKDAPMVFTAASCEAGTVVFDGQGTRAGEHMTYRRDGNRLSFIGDFIHNGQHIRAEETFERAAQ